MWFLWTNAKPNQHSLLKDFHKKIRKENSFIQIFISLSPNCQKVTGRHVILNNFSINTSKTETLIWNWNQSIDGTYDESNIKNSKCEINKYQTLQLNPPANLYLYKSQINLKMEYCHIWAGASQYSQ